MTHRDGFPRLSARSAWRGDAGHRKPWATPFESLDRAGLTCNKNAVPLDPEKPAVTSGLRFGTSAATTRGFAVADFRLVGAKIAEVLDGLARDPEANGACEAAVFEEVRELTARFPIYGAV